jgi:hypothetical protein
MLTQQEIARMFEEMGLANEEDRIRFAEFAKLEPKLDTGKEQIFIRVATTTSIEECKDARLV